MVRVREIKTGKDGFVVRVREFKTGKDGFVVRFYLVSDRDRGGELSDPRAMSQSMMWPDQ